MNCWNCSAPLLLNDNKVSFRSTCDQCHFYLHCCKNCTHYKPGSSNDCSIPGTERVADRAANNFCEDFKILGKAANSKQDPSEAEKRLFGDSDLKKPEPPTSRFNSLFDS